MRSANKYKHGERPKKRLLTTIEAAEIINVKPRTLIEWRATGAGPKYAKLNHLIRYREIDVDGFIEQKLRWSTSDSGNPT